MTALSRFEASLLRILHGILQRAPLERVQSLVLTDMPMPPCLAREAVVLIQNTLARGLVSILARQGWRRERHLRLGQVREGRLWERIPLEERRLEFSPFSMTLLIWLTATAARASDMPECDLEQLTAADRLLTVLAYQLLRNTDLGASLRKCAFVTSNALCRLIFAEDFGSEKSAPDWRPWSTGVGACIIEAFQDTLRDRWLEMERGKAHVKSPTLLREMGEGQERMLTGFLDAMNGAQRRDLTRFLLPTVQRLLADDPSCVRLVKGLNLQGLRLADRAQVYRAVLVLPRTLLRLRQWEREARTVGYFDEDYAASQLWKADWERYDGEELCRRAEEILREAQPL